MNKSTVIAAILAISSIIMPRSGMAETTIRVADSLPVGHYFSDYALKFWMDEVSRVTDGAISFDYFPAGQLGKAEDMLQLTASGVIDVGYVAPSYVSSKMPLSAVAELPGNYSESCAATKAYLELATGDGIIAKSDYQANGVRLLFALVLPPYQIFTSETPLTDVKSFKGLKLRAAGGAMQTTTHAIDAVPIQMSAPQLHQSLARGTVDGMLFPYAALPSYDLVGLIKYGTVGENFGSAVLTYVINIDTWRSLSPELKTAMTKAGVKASMRACRLTTQDSQKVIDTLRKSGVVLTSFTGMKGKTLDSKLQNVNRQWAESVDSRGEPGSELVSAFRDALRGQ